MLIALGLVVIYVVSAWLVFFRFKLMKFTIVWGVVGFWVGLHMFLIFIVALRFFQPYSIGNYIPNLTAMRNQSLCRPGNFDSLAFCAHANLRAESRRCPMETAAIAAQEVSERLAPSMTSGP